MPTPASPNTPVALVGREHELAVLRQHLDAALAGQGSLVLIGGEAGIGKTALAETLCHEAEEQGALVLTGRCFDLTETPAYGPWLYLFDRYQPHSLLPARPPAFAERGFVGEVGSQAALFRQVLTFLEALTGHCPLVLLVDDLHWSDPASLDLLRYLAQSVATLPVLILVTYRRDELTRRHSLYTLLPFLIREGGAARLDLPPLDGAAVQTLVMDRYDLSDEDRTRLVTDLQARAEGNVFFVGELLRTLEESGALHRDDAGWHLDALTQTMVPPLLRQVIAGRLARLDAESQRALAVAAIIGHEVPLALWATVSDVDEDALIAVIEQGVDARLLVEVGGGEQVRFAHALVREALYEGIVAVRRRRVHRRVAEALTALRAPDPDAVAYHFQQAGDERAVQWLIMAGERAARIQALFTAAARFEAALALLDQAGAETSERGWLLNWLGWVHRYNEPRRSATYFEEAQRVARITQDQALAVRALSQLGLVHSMSGDARRGISEMEAAFALRETIPVADLGRPWVAVIGPADEDEATLRALRDGSGLVMWYGTVGRYAEARASGESFIADALAPALLRTALQRRIAAYYGDTYFGLAHAYAAMGMPDAARDMYARADGMYRVTQNELMLYSVAMQMLYLVILPYRADDPIERRRVANEAAEAMGRARGVQVNVASHMPDLLILVHEGAWAEARLHALDETERLRQNAPIIQAGVLGSLARAQGDTAGAWSFIRAWFPDGPTTAQGNISFRPAVALQRLAALLALDDGDLPMAHAWLEAHNRWFAWSGAVHGQSEGQALWARYFRQAGDADQAYACATRAFTHATDPRQPLALLAAHRLLGELDTDASRFNEAAPHLDASLALADACAAPFERALTLLAMAELRAATGDADAALHLLADVHAICEPLDAKPTLVRVAALQSRIASAPTLPPNYPAGLSAREVEVLRLVAAGLTNPQIAARLFLSPRTIEQHLRNIYGKLDVSSRTAAARWATDHGLL